MQYILRNSISRQHRHRGKGSDLSVWSTIIYRGKVYMNFNLES